MTMTLLEALIVVTDMGRCTDALDDYEMGVYNNAKGILHDQSKSIALRERYYVQPISRAAPAFPSPSRQPAVAVEFNSDDWLAAYHQDRTCPFK